MRAGCNDWLCCDELEEGYEQVTTDAYDFATATALGITAGHAQTMSSKPVFHNLNTSRRRRPGLQVTASIAFLFVGWARAEEQPPLSPIRDVEVIYDVKRPYRSWFREHIFWLADQGLERIDGPDGLSVIFDRKANLVILLNSSTRTYSTSYGVPRSVVALEVGRALQRGRESVVDAMRCTDWTWMDDAETHTACITLDGVPLRLVVDGEIRLRARSIAFRVQEQELFRVPPGYVPALASPEAPRLVR